MSFDPYPYIVLMVAIAGIGLVAYYGMLMV